MDSLPDITSSFEFAACGLVTTSSDGEILRSNATFCKWIGFADSELINHKKIQDLFTVGGRFFHHTHWAPLLHMQGSVSEVQMDLVAKDGTLLPMFINVNRQSLADSSFNQIAFFLVKDRKSFEKEIIDARKTAEQSIQSLRETQKELQDSKDALSIAIRSARMGTWSYDIQRSEIWWSSELVELTGIKQEGYWRKLADFHSLIHKEDLKGFVEALRVAVDEKTEYNVQFRLRHCAGHWLTMEGRGLASYSGDSEAVSIFGVFIDISERKEAEKQLLELNSQLSLADRRKDEFLATLGHELRNPLAPMRNILELMRLKEHENSFIQWSREIIERHVSQMTHLVDDLMDSSRISQGKLELRKQRSNIVELVKNACSSEQDLMQEFGHKFVMNLPNSPIMVDADATRITQIVSNLLTNAAKYTPANGAITLAVYQEADEAIISIIDSGIGIAPDKLQSIFNMFSQLTPAIGMAQGGLGIGLALVDGFVKLHDGTISAFSKGDGNGSEFVVRLPVLATGVAIHTQATDPVVPSVSSACKRILIIEDNTDAALTLTKLLEYKGHSVKSASDGKTGVNLAKTFKPDVILSDIGLPDMSGYEIAQHIRQQPWGKSMLLIATTGWGQDKDKELATSAGFDKHLTKPIDFKILLGFL